LASLEEYTELLRPVWERGILTHNGPMVQQFEIEFCEHFKIKNMVAVSNGTIALQMAIKALELKGEIITSPFTWIATISAIKWEGCKPVFADIDPESLNIDPKKIEAQINSNTVAIMPVHVFGNPCEVDEIKAIASKYNLKVIYDAAHAVGSVYNGSSLLKFGDISATSFHATKLLNTAEGGACVAQDPELIEKLKRIRFFGHDDAKNIVEDGFNGKMTEVHATLGLANLKYIDAVLEDRKQKSILYRNSLKDVSAIRFQKINMEECNCSYFPVIFQSEENLQQTEKALNKENIFPRRYFYPSVNTFNRVVDYTSCAHAEDVANKILCLPLFFDLSTETIEQITDVIKEC
jgi:dTDP-4-amino-4,6-dideoxygalactose transaminase